MTDRYIKGLFITERTGQYGKYLSIGITEEGLQALKSINPNEKGVRNFFASPQRNDPSKYSAQFPKEQTQGQASSDNSPVKTDDLPF